MRGVTAGKALSAVFGRSGDVNLIADGIIRLNPETKLIDGESIKADLR